MPQPRNSRRGRDAAANNRILIDAEDIGQLEAGRMLVVQQLEEAHATEAALVTTLGAHISMTPEGPYRNVLERHVDETKEQAEAIQDRLAELGANRSVAAASFGLVQTLVGQALSIGKGPIDLLRGRAGEEKLLKNAKDECATEALEIATYDGLEATARAVGDTKTAELAVRHREQEERMLTDLRNLIPQLSGAVVRSLAAGDASYDVSTTGAAEGVRGVRDEVAKEARSARNTATRRAKSARDTATKEAKSARDKATKEAGQARDSAAKRGKATARKVERAAEGPRTSDLPIKGYDDLTAAEVNRQVSDLSGDQVRKVEDYERRHQNRATVLNRLDSAKSNA